MALLPSLPISSTPKFHIKLFLGQPCHLPRCSAIQLPQQTRHARTCLMKISMADHNEPDEIRVQIGNMKEKLREILPISVREFPWSKAEHKLVDRLISLAREALKWALVLYFVLGSISDIVYTLSINRELVIPIGLLIGCLTADFLKETLQELFHISEDKANGGLMQALWYWKSSREKAKNWEEGSFSSSAL
ncbi:hypothetical protein QN277_017799 [Acacia crassicarpa]|uniref:Uncharacterized protein n=1 Tax=Acacia crassicarpa TaxID=499986 RepID=A0AAE1JUW2_9FABA|nr:hypothetical protein QN277_017799 [Acacia crassicarpa]